MLRECVRVARMMLAKGDAEKSGKHEVRPCRRGDAEGIRRHDEVGFATARAFRA